MHIDAHMPSQLNLSQNSAIYFEIKILCATVQNFQMDEYIALFLCKKQCFGTRMAGFIAV